MHSTNKIQWEEWYCSVHINGLIWSNQTGYFKMQKGTICQLVSISALYLMMQFKAPIHHFWKAAERGQISTQSVILESLELGTLFPIRYNSFHPCTLWHNYGSWKRALRSAKCPRSCIEVGWQFWKCQNFCIVYILLF